MSRLQDGADQVIFSRTTPRPGKQGRPPLQLSRAGHIVAEVQKRISVAIGKPERQGISSRCPTRVVGRSSRGARRPGFANALHHHHLCRIAFERHPDCNASGATGRRSRQASGHSVGVVVWKPADGNRRQQAATGCNQTYQRYGSGGFTYRLSRSQLLTLLLPPVIWRCPPCP